MKLCKSKKGIGTSVIVDVFMLLAYFIIFVLVIFIISRVDSRTEVRNEALTIDYNLELINGLRTPITLEGPRTITFADYLAEYADRPLCDENGRAVIDKDFDSVMMQMEPYFNHLKSKGACISIVFGSDVHPKYYIDLNTYCEATDYVASYIENKYPCKDKVFRGSIKYPSRDKHVITVLINSEQ